MENEIKTTEQWPLDKEYKCKTVGELKALLANCPDDWILVTVNDNGDAVDVTAVNSFWHGALTFEIS